MYLWRRKYRRRIRILRVTMPQRWDRKRLGLEKGDELILLNFFNCLIKK